MQCTKLTLVMSLYGSLIFFLFAVMFVLFLFSLVKASLK